MPTQTRQWLPAKRRLDQFDVDLVPKKPLRLSRILAIIMLAVALLWPVGMAIVFVSTFVMAPRGAPIAGTNEVIDQRTGNVYSKSEDTAAILSAAGLVGCCLPTGLFLIGETVLGLSYFAAKSFEQ